MQTFAIPKGKYDQNGISGFFFCVCLFVCLSVLLFYFSFFKIFANIVLDDAK